MDVPRRREPTAPPARADGGPGDGTGDRDLPTGWVTTVVRPAGRLQGPALAAVLVLLQAAAAAGGAVLLDLRAADRLPAELLREVVALDAHLAADGGILLVLDPDDRHDLPAGLVRDAGALELVLPAVVG